MGGDAGGTIRRRALRRKIKEFGHAELRFLQHIKEESPGRLF